MATNYRGYGRSLNIPAPIGGVVSGMGYVIGSMFGVAGADANVGELFALHLDGIYDLPKNTAEAWTVGQAINWDTGSAWATAGTGGTKIGVCSEQASSAATVGEVRLNGAF